MTPAYYRLPMPAEHMQLAVEWIRDAEWDEHWAVILYSAEHRDELFRCCTFTEGKKFAQKVLLEALRREVAA